MTSDAGFSTLNLEAGVQTIGSTLTQQMGGGGAGTQGLLSMVMGFVYPFLKPMMEASIRKVTVVVRWNEGTKVKEFTAPPVPDEPEQRRARASAGQVASVDGASAARDDGPRAPCGGALMSAVRRGAVTLARARGMTLLEILVSLAILAMMALLIYGAFDSMNSGIKGEEVRSGARTRGAGRAPPHHP